MMNQSTENNNRLDVDIVIFGGGVAGLWLLSRLRQAGYQTLLLEKNALGAGQTRFSQGIIHGGTKYALTGKLTASSESIFDMPRIWRDCLQGRGEVDLQEVKVLSEYQYMWSTPGLISRLAGFFTSRIVRGRMQLLKKDQYPALFRHKKFHGKVYRLDEPVLDAGSIILALAEPNLEATLQYSSLHQFSPQNMEVTDNNGTRWQISCQQTILTAGEGNAALLQMLGRQQPEMQVRPLQMVMVRGGLPEKIYAHCLGASSNPRITITSHEDDKGNIVWYLGGQLAEEGVQRSEQEQIQKAKKELHSLMPWLDISVLRWATLWINRAEVKQADGSRPASSFCMEEDHIITAWPTKLALTPGLAADIMQLLEEKNVSKSGVKALHGFTNASIATLPWQEEDKWKN